MLNFSRLKDRFVCILLENVDMVFGIFEKLQLIRDIFKILVEKRIWSAVRILMVKIFGAVSCFEKLKVFRRGPVDS